MSNRKGKACSYALLCIILFDLFRPYTLSAGNIPVMLSRGGPVAASAADYVDPFSGDFHYSVPLLSVPGPNGENVPITASYSAGIRMNQSASWIGLGWDFNPGEISRQVNGVPDDNNGKVNYNAACNVGNGEVTETAIFGPMYYDTPGTPSFTISNGTFYTGSYPVVNKKRFSHDTYVNNFTKIHYIGSGSDPSGDIVMPYANPDYDNYRVSGNGLGGSLEPYAFDNITLKIDRLSQADLATTGNSIKTLQFNFERSADMNYVSTDATTNRKKTGYFVKYFTNDNINTNISTNGFLDYRVVSSGTRRYTTDFDTDGFGGFQITTTEGLTYHYSLPVYSENEQTLSFCIVGNTHDFTDRDISLQRKSYKYATSWKLTAITGPDYIDDGNHYVDSADTGYWIAYDYSLWCDDYEWASPMYGYKKDMQYKQWPKTNSNYGQSFYKKKGVVSSGNAQSYYLNKIRTATHTALFVKSIRIDEQSMDHLRNSSNSAKPQLKLDKIVLMRNEDLSAFGNTQSIPSVSGYSTSSCDPNNDLIHMGDYNYYLTAIENAALKIIDLTYDYSLCRKNYSNINNTVTSSAFDYDNAIADRDTAFNDINNRGMNIGYTKPTSVTNSNNDQSGKLTLKQIKARERGGISVFPPYDFTYNSKNPDFDPDKADIWGFYKCDYVSNKRSYYTTPTSKDSVDAWSLSEVVTPLGGKIKISYESDEYVYEGTKKTQPWFIFLADDMTGNYPTFANEADATDYGTSIKVTYAFPATSCIGEYYWGYDEGVLFRSPDPYVVNCGSVNTNYDPENGDLALATKWGWSKNTYALAYGGGLRVKDIKIEDPESSQEYALEYTYENGLCANKPDRFRIQNYTLTDNVTQTDRDNPGPFVGYEKTSVKTISNNGHDNGKTVFDFDINFSNAAYAYDMPFTPEFQSQGTLYYTDSCQYNNTTELESHCRVNTSYRSYKFTLTKKVGVNGQFGKLIKRSVYDSNDALLAYTSNSYKTVTGIKESYKYYNQSITDTSWFYKPRVSHSYDVIPPPIGETTLTTHLTGTIGGQRFYNLRNFQVVLNYLTKEFTTLDKTETYSNGVTTVSQINERDPVNMQPLSTTVIDPTQGAITTIITPAYTNTVSYSDMGLKSACSGCETNKNMVSLVEEQRVIKQPVFRNTDGQVTFNSTSPGILMGASKQTYASTVYRRKYNAGSGKYENTSEASGTWLPYESYSALTTASTPSSTTTPTWKKTNTITLYNTLNKALETEGMSGRKSAVKLGYNNLWPLSSISDANYNCFGFSSFEDKINVNPSGTAVWHFGGEVTGGIYQSAATNAVKPHTGNYVAAVPAETFGPGIVLNGYEKGRTYRASVWVHKASSSNAILAIACDGSVSGTPTYLWQSVDKTNANNITVGDWILMSVQLTVPENFVESGGANGNSFTIFLWNGTGSTSTAWFDDLMVRPVDAPITGTVYDPVTARIMATLDNENFASYFEYDAAGRVTATYKETRLGIKKISETQYNFSRQ